MLLISGRTPEQWRAFDRATLVGAAAFVLVLAGLWWAGAGPRRAAACCIAPADTGVAAPSSERPAAPAAIPEAVPPAPCAVATPDPACVGALDSSILFATSSAELSMRGRDGVDRMARCVGEGRYEVAGHTDSTGGDALNQRLSEARARTVLDRLVEDGVSRDRLRVRGYASTQPAADERTEEGRAKNRRVELRSE